MRPYYDRAIGKGMDPASIADLVAEAIVSDRFWILPHPAQIASEIQAALTAPTA